MAKWPAIGLLVGMVGGTAAAEPEVNVLAPPMAPAQNPHGLWLDFGVVYGRVGGAGQSFTTEMVQFAPHLALSHLLYAGAEFDGGRLADRTGTLMQDPTTGLVIANNIENTGEVAMAKLLVGARGMVGLFSAGGELAVGFQDLVVREQLVANAGAAIADGDTGGFSTTYEARGRFDFWATPKLTIGALATVNMVSARDDLSIGLVVGVHFLPYDGIR
jgi:hypothetical protein